MINTFATVTGYLVLSVAGTMVLLCVITNNKYKSAAVL